MNCINSRLLESIKMGRFKLVAATAFLIAFSTGCANGSTYDVQFVGSFFDVFAQITVDGSNDVTTITGTVSGPSAWGLPASISGLEPLNGPNQGAVWNYDNALSGTAPYVSNP